MTDELWPTVPESPPPGFDEGTPPSGAFHVQKVSLDPSVRFEAPQQPMQSLPMLYWRVYGTIPPLLLSHV